LKYQNVIFEHGTSRLLLRKTDSTFSLGEQSIVLEMKTLDPYFQATKQPQKLLTTCNKIALFVCLFLYACSLRAALEERLPSLMQALPLVTSKVIGVV